MLICAEPACLYYIGQMSDTSDGSDPRIQRTRSALRAAVLALAAERAVLDLTAVEVARHAGVSRDTFYRYAANPVSLLATVLAEDLEDAARALPAGSTVGTAERAVLQHIAGRAAVYRGAMRPAFVAPVRENLERFFRDGLLVWARSRPDSLPPEVAASDGAIEMAAAYAAGGTVAAIEAWLRRDELDIDRATGVILAASPAWWLL